MFQCPLCRQVANLEASVAEPDEISEMDIEDDSMEDLDVDAPAQDSDSVLERDIPLSGSEDVRMNEEEVADLSHENSPRSSNPVRIPSRAGGIETILSPSTPVLSAVDRGASNSAQPRRPDVPVQIFNTLTKLADSLSKGDD